MVTCDLETVEGADASGSATLDLQRTRSLMVISMSAITLDEQTCTIAEVDQKNGRERSLTRPQAPCTNPEEEP